jgi:hypothetical protein
VRRFIVILAFVALAGSAIPRGQTPPAVAIRGATILTVTKGTIRNGTIVLRGGKIEAVGAGVSVPAGAQISPPIRSTRVGRR